MQQDLRIILRITVRRYALQKALHRRPAVHGVERQNSLRRVNADGGTGFSVLAMESHYIFVARGVVNRIPPAGLGRGGALVSAISLCRPGPIRIDVEADRESRPVPSVVIVVMDNPFWRDGELDVPHANQVIA